MMRCPDCGLLLSGGGHAYVCRGAAPTPTIVNYDELIAAARAVLADYDQFDPQDQLGTIADVIERLRRALPK
jgi:hypothetical protein